tara:strand:+ start:30 stop:560 length:531 start_codon:yes stop_codon:yes gene_type:complete
MPDNTKNSIISKINEMIQSHSLSVDAQMSSVNDNEIILTHHTSGEQAMVACPMRLGTVIDVALSLEAQAIRQEKVKPITLGDYLFFEEQHLLTAINGDTEIRLTDKEVDIIRALKAAADSQLTREDLLEKVWGYKQELETHTLETHIYRLRQKIEKDPNAPKTLTTIKNGYKLIWS